MSMAIISAYLVSYVLFFDGQSIFIHIFHGYLSRRENTILMIGQLHTLHLLVVVFIEPFWGSGAVALHPAE
jgi:hypothetical protein